MIVKAFDLDQLIFCCFTSQHRACKRPLLWLQPFVSTRPIANQFVILTESTQGRCSVAPDTIGRSIQPHKTSIAVRNDNPDRQRVQHRRQQALDSLALGFLTFSFGDVLDLDHRTEDPAVLTHRAGAESDLVEVTVFVNENFLALSLPVLWKRAFDRALFGRVGRPVRPRMMHQVVERTAPSCRRMNSQSVSRQRGS